MPQTVIANFDMPATEKSIAKWVQGITIKAAEAALRAEVAKGFDNQPVVVTDGVPRRDYNGVKPFGKIEFIRRPNMAEVVMWALSELQKRSPVKTGHYVSSHVVMINGAEVGGNIMGALKSVKETDRVQIVNTAPYAKKIEGRKGSRKRGVSAVAGLSKQAPRGVYERVVLPLLVQRYGRSMFFDFKYVKLNTNRKVWGFVGGGRTRVKGKWIETSGRSRKRILRDALYPALAFFIKPTGLPN